jgi:hypothetical protein
MPVLGPEAEILHEIDSEGRDAGVEFEVVADEGEITEPFDPRLIEITTEMRNLDTLIKRLQSAQIDLDPDFQRSRGIWTDQKKSLLIESLLLRIPLPTFYVAEVDLGDELGADGWAVVDGIQRLSTVAQFVDSALVDMPPLRLRGLEYLRTEEGKSFDDLSSSLQLRILESQFTIQVIRRSTPEPVKLNIFARINTGGVPLSAQELRHALTPGPARHILRDLASSPEFRSAVDHSISPTRMVDREMVLRFLAFRMIDPETYREQDFDNFLRSSMRSINSWTAPERARHTADFAAAMRAARMIFGNDAFRKRYDPSQSRRPVSKALFEAIAVGLARTRDAYGDDGLRVLASWSPQVLARFIALMNEREFDRAISQGTGDPVRVRHRFLSVRTALANIVENAR